MRLEGWRHAGAVAAAKGAAAAVVLGSGFRAVSDDDFARVVIAEQWARAPRWDPSGTSWLPAPFWIVGAAMAAFGRGLGTARAAAVALGIAAALLVYTAARWLGEPRDAAAAGAGVAAIFPWSALLGVATVPELPAAALTLLAIVSLAPGGDAGVRATRRLWGAAALALATLSRYEAWPVAAVFAAVCVVSAARERSGRAAAAAGLALLGPAAWMAWNAVAHQDALHFVARVTAYRRALGGEPEGVLARLATYPLATVREEPELVALLVAAAALVAARGGLAALREGLGPYARPAALAAAQIAALSLAMARDEAPTHHPERAVLAALLLMAVAAGALAARALRGGARAGRAAVLLGAVALAVKIARPATPREAFAARGDEEAIGRAAAALARPGERVLVEGADYGYLAVTAALGRPEDVEADRSVDPRDARVASSFDDPDALARRVTTSGARWIVAHLATPARSALGEPAATRGAWAVFAARERGAAP